MSPVPKTSRSWSPTRSTMAWKPSLPVMPCWMPLMMPKLARASARPEPARRELRSRCCSCAVRAATLRLQPLALRRVCSAPRRPARRACPAGRGRCRESARRRRPDRRRVADDLPARHQRRRRQLRWAIGSAPSGPWRSRLCRAPRLVEPGTDGAQQVVVVSPRGSSEPATVQLPGRTRTPAAPVGAAQLGGLFDHELRPAPPRCAAVQAQAGIDQALEGLRRVAAPTRCASRSAAGRRRWRAWAIQASTMARRSRAC